MSEKNDAVLRRAYEFIENDELERAQEILAPLLEADTDNASLWWVYTHAVRDKAIGQAALDRVIELDPAYPGAGELKADLLEFQSGGDDFVALEHSENGSAPASADFDIDDWEDLQPALETEVEASSSRKGFALLAIVLVIIAAGAGLVASGAIELPDWLSGLLPTPEPVVIVVSAPTEQEPPLTIQPEETAAPDQVLLPSQATPGAHGLATAESVEDEDVESAAAFVRLIAEGIEDFPIVSAPPGIYQTGLGNTVVIQACAVPGSEFSDRLKTVMYTVADTAEDIPEAADAIGVGLLNCADEDASLRIIGVLASQIQQFANEEIDDKEFQRAWQPLP